MTYNTKIECSLMGPMTLNDFNKKVLYRLPSAPWIQIYEEKDFLHLNDVNSLAAAILAKKTVSEVEKMLGYVHKNIYLIRIDTTESVLFGVYPIVDK